MKRNWKTLHPLLGFFQWNNWSDRGESGLKNPPLSLLSVPNKIHPYFFPWHPLFLWKLNYFYQLLGAKYFDVWQYREGISRLQHMKNKDVWLSFGIWKTGVWQLHASSWNSEAIDRWKVACHPPSRCVMVCDDHPF